jgi:hypothetical protein
MHAPPKLRLDLLEPRPHAVAPSFPLKLEVPLARFAAEVKSQERQGFRFSKVLPLAVDCRKAAELNQAGLVRVERRRKLLKPRADRIEKATGVALMLEADDHV